VTRGIAIAIALAATACRSPATTYYTLVAPRAAPTASAEPAAGFQLDVLPVDVPAQVDRAQLVVREAAGELTPVDTRSWIAPLSAELQRALSNALSAQLGARDVAGLTADAALPTLRIKLNVQRFESVLGQFAEIDALWTVSDPAGGKLLCAGQIREPATTGYEGIAEAHQRALAKLAGQIADGVRAVRAQQAGATCPGAVAATR
jgi:uncharacterized protein